MFRLRQLHSKRHPSEVSGQQWDVARVVAGQIAARVARRQLRGEGRGQQEEEEEEVKVEEEEEEEKEEEEKEEEEEGRGQQAQGKQLRGRSQKRVSG